ncbi:hypothetical protein [Streptacidiphilus rugosus]|uniref:hypothetical protein n=1 Tax=Streptacidiphilus rugosus TaxID=405783 RepID=UPI000B2644FF|nr:hypothetical protein [Streptacidiphilus rugosus]
MTEIVDAAPGSGLGTPLGTPFGTPLDTGRLTTITTHRTEEHSCSTIRAPTPG